MLTVRSDVVVETVQNVMLKQENVSALQDGGVLPVISVSITLLTPGGKQSQSKLFLISAFLWGYFKFTIIVILRLNFNSLGDLQIYIHLLTHLFTAKKVIVYCCKSWFEFSFYQSL